jgi:hypothetical protein
MVSGIFREYEMFSLELLCFQNVCSLFHSLRWLIAVF